MTTRRRFVATSAAATLAKAPASRPFPNDFAGGAATAACQIEGARDADGRGRFTGLARTGALDTAA